MTMLKKFTTKGWERVDGTYRVVIDVLVPEPVWLCPEGISWWRQRSRARVCLCYPQDHRQHRQLPTTVCYRATAIWNEKFNFCCQLDISWIFDLQYIYIRGIYIKRKCINELLKYEQIFLLNYKKIIL